MDDLIAARSLIAKSPTGERTLLTIQIGAPYQNGDDDWACPLHIDGLGKPLPELGGVDSFQALMLALNLAKSLLKRIAATGKKLYAVYDADDEDAPEIDIELMFAKGL